MTTSIALLLVLFWVCLNGLQHPIKQFLVGYFSLLSNNRREDPNLQAHRPILQPL
ncbi:hypothetical protein BJX76DRAFT_342828 [Aspergillus varians]